MKVEELKNKSKKDVLNFIRKRLAFDKSISGQLRHIEPKDFEKEHRRFEMSGYEDIEGENTVFNQSILNEFANLGIYNYTSYLFLDFFKGTPTLYLQYFGENTNLVIELGGYGTTEIIYEVFKLTIFSDKNKRRRS